MKQTLYFPEGILEKLKTKAHSKGLSISSYIRMVLLERWEKEE